MADVQQKPKIEDDPSVLEIYGNKLVSTSFDGGDFMPFFSERVSMLEVRNGALKKTAGERAERVDELERELQQMTQELERLKAERAFYFKRMTELEEHNRVVTEAATKYASWGQKLFSDLAALDPDGAPRRCATQEAPYVAAPQGLLSQPAFGCAVASAEFPRRVCELAPGP
jgi:hypothetical protein